MSSLCDDYRHRATVPGFREGARPLRPEEESILPLFTELPRETVRKVEEAVSGRCVFADIDTEIGLLRPLFPILGLHGSKLLRLFGQSRKRTSRKLGCR